MAQWKALEREVAKKLGGKRNYRMGNWGESMADVEHKIFSIECKEGKQVPKFFYDGLKQAGGYDGGKVPIVVAHRYREKKKVVCMYLDDFCDFFGTVNDV